MAAKQSGPVRCRRKFLRFFPKGFYDEKYLDWERGYKRGGSAVVWRVRVCAEAGASVVYCK